MTLHRVGQPAVTAEWSSGLSGWFEQQQRLRLVEEHPTAGVQGLRSTLCTLQGKWADTAGAKPVWNFLVLCVSGWALHNNLLMPLSSFLHCYSWESPASSQFL